MYMIILAAGQGSRLRPLTDKCPKCLVEIGGKALLDWQLEVVRSVGIHKIAVVRGYLQELIDREDVTYFENAAYESTNMVETLWCAQSVFGDEFIVSYGDIIYEPEVLQHLLASDHPISVAVDQKWEQYWRLRFDDVLSDAETLEVDNFNRIRSIGQQPKSIDQIEGQYIGLMAFRGSGIKVFQDVYQQARLESVNGCWPLRGQRPFHKLYMTDMLQGIIDSGFPVHQIPINRGWVEIDSVYDITVAENLIHIENNKFQIR